MREFQMPKHAVGTDERQEECRAEMRSAMHHIVKKAIQCGWLECELVMALADVAEDRTMVLAADRPAPVLHLVPKS